MKALGIDLGERHVGVAICDDEELEARPYQTLEVTGATLVAKLVAMLRAEQPTEVVLGLPLHMDGRESTSSRKARKLAVELERELGVPVHLQDERLTTSQAHTHRVMAGVKGRAGIDSRAAAIVLQTFLEARKARCRRDDDPNP